MQSGSECVRGWVFLPEGFEPGKWHLRFGTGLALKADVDFVDLAAGVAKQALVDVADLFHVDVAEDSPRITTSWTERRTWSMTRSETAMERLPSSVVVVRNGNRAGSNREPP